MKELPHPKSPKRKRGIALIVVISVLALATILLLAMFSVTETEFKSTQSYAAGVEARKLGDSAVNLVVQQLQGAARQEPVEGREFHVTQPGAARKYSNSGAFLAGYKLYSDSQMVAPGGATGELSWLTEDVPPVDWAARSARYVDMNEPVTRPSATTAGQYDVHFPIVDPRAATDDASTPNDDRVEGFSYSDKSAVSNGEFTGVVLPDAGSVNTLRLPMPVEWVYVFEDGQLGFVDNDGRFTGQSPRPTATNPVVGRVAFWTDDESCKVNINTASEPTHWAPPTFMHKRDQNYGDCPPTQFEYQRYPGHPATVALSSVLYPNFDLDTGTDAQLAQYRAIKERIYQLAPRINNGGSIGGTLPYTADEIISSNPAVKVDVSTSLLEHLYSSIDEFQFSSDLLGNLRKPNDFVVGTQNLLSAKTIERARFFMTAQSRSPDFSMMGVPRIACWPVADESLGESYRTIYDKLIAFCATYNQDPANSYYFRRKMPHTGFKGQAGHGSNVDLNEITRNTQLMNYLAKMVGVDLAKSKYPSGASGSAKSFAENDKYGSKDPLQILVEIFDYIRATNVYDGNLAPKFDKDSATGGDLPNLMNNAASPTSGSKDAFNMYKDRDNLVATSFKTYTEPRYWTWRTHDSTRINDSTADSKMTDVKIASGSFPGHGQVTPSHWRKNGETYMGFGRSVTVSEAALHFICTADGKTDDNSYQTWMPDNGSWKKSGTKSGGRTAAKMSNLDNNNQWVHDSDVQLPSGFSNAAAIPFEKPYWYSNYPPFPGFNRNKPEDVALATSYGVDLSAALTDIRHPAYHPGYDPNNWNLTLESGKALKEDEKRIQVLLHLELFCPAVAWTKIHPELTIVVNGNDASGIKIGANGEPMLNTTSNIIIKTSNPIYDVFSAHGIGGHVSFRAFSQDRNVAPRGALPQDPSYDSSTTAGKHTKISNMDLASGFFTVPRDEFQFRVDRPIRIDIYDTHDVQNLIGNPDQNAVQTIFLQFPSGDQHVRTPDLVVNSSERRRNVNSDGTIAETQPIHAPRFWTFNSGGALMRFRNGITAATYWNPATRNTVATNKDVYDDRCRGRFHRPSTTISADSAGPPGGKAGKMPYYGTLIYGADPYSSNYSGVAYVETGPERDNPLLNYGGDVVRSIIPRYGDYRIQAARRIVPAEAWAPHPMWTSNPNLPFAHNLGSFDSSSEPGYDRDGAQYGQTTATRRLVANANYRTNQIPDMPHTDEATAASNAFGDFDNGITDMRDGPYINKADEGNLSYMNFWLGGAQHFVRNGYFLDSWLSEATREASYTPNRMMPSPVMFGSLSTGVWGSDPASLSSSITNKSANGVPWRTLLFRPHTRNNDSPAPQTTHPGARAPQDHYLLDLYYMPIVEPYAISEPLSTAGRINVNYQIVPFTNIRRATGMHAALKGEWLTAVPKTNVDKYHISKSGFNGAGNEWPQKIWDDSDNTRWHRKINIEETLKQFDDRFSLNQLKASVSTIGLLRSATQICEIHLIPKDVTGGVNVNTSTITNATTRNNAMNTFWTAHNITGDNVRERPYATIYPKLTARSNTFRVHMRCQTIKKARSVAPDQIDPAKDLVASEYRGSALLERYIDPNEQDPNRKLPNYATLSDPLAEPQDNNPATWPLDYFYRFRVVENKRFAP